MACGPQGLTPDGDVLYRNNGDGTFTDVTSGAGVAVRPAFGLGLLWFDSDNDRDPDLYVANDSMGNFLFLNHGDGTFQEVGLLSSVAYDEDGKEQAGMGVAAGDYDRDGHFDLYVTNFSDDYNTLYRNLGNGFFRDVTYAAGLGTATWPFLAWGTGFADLDNDGWEDLFVSNGHIYPQVDDYEIGSTYLERNQFFLNLGNGKFQEIKGAFMGGGERPRSSRGSAFADYDNDGDLDIGINNLDGAPSLLRNDGPQSARHWLILALEGVRSNRSAIGDPRDYGNRDREADAGGVRGLQLPGQQRPAGPFRTGLRRPCAATDGPVAQRRGPEVSGRGRRPALSPSGRGGAPAVHCRPARLTAGDQNRLGIRGDPVKSSDYPRMSSVAVVMTS